MRRYLAMVLLACGGSADNGGSDSGPENPLPAGSAEVCTGVSALTGETVSAQCDAVVRADETTEQGCLVVDPEPCFSEYAARRLAEHLGCDVIVDRRVPCPAVPAPSADAGE